MDKKAILREYIRKDLMNDSSGQLDDAQDLLAAGIVDSLGLLRLVSFVEEQFGTEVADEDVTFENFQSIVAITDYLDKHQ